MIPKLHHSSQQNMHFQIVKIFIGYSEVYPKKKDKIILSGVKKNIIKCYLVGKNINFFQKQIQNKLKFSITKNLKDTLIRIFKDIKLFDLKLNTILLSPAAASYDQFNNFKQRGDKFKKLSKLYLKKYV